ncbi:MAG: TrmH family RNA methyltransferase [Acidobacteriota bacterium]
MKINRIVLIETSSPGNLGAALRVAANFNVATVALVRPKVAPDDPIVDRWACGARQHVGIEVFDDLDGAAAHSRTLVATASGRGRPDQPAVSPAEAIDAVAQRGPEGAALVFGSETRGMNRDDLDRCDLAVRIPTDPSFPVLNLVQSIAILLSHFAIEQDPSSATSPEPATHDTVEALMAHLHTTLADIGYLDPVNPDRILRKIRRVFGRAGITENEATIFRGICRQIEWARKNPRDPGGEAPGRFSQGSGQEDN